jgi:deoxyribodipyrimidine photo-lyase
LIKKGNLFVNIALNLASYSDKSIHAPWLAGRIELDAAKVTLGKDYPFPIIAHDEARKQTLLRYSVVKSAAIDEEKP